MLEDLGQNEAQAAARTETVAEKVLDVVSQPCRLETHKFYTSPSIGITLFTGQDITADDILANLPYDPRCGMTRRCRQASNRA